MDTIIGGRNMGDSGSQDYGALKKHCKVCGEPIAKEAKKCIHCDSYQDWRRHLSFSSTVLALLTALLSVATVAVPVLRDLVIEPDSNLVASFQSLDNHSANFVVSNTGSRPGTVGQARFWIIDKTDHGTGFSLPMKGSPDQVFIEPQKSKLISFDLRYEDIKKQLSNLDLRNYRCELRLSTIQFSGRPTESPLRNANDFTKNIDCASFLLGFPQ